MEGVQIQVRRRSVRMKDLEAGVGWLSAYLEAGWRVPKVEVKTQEEYSVQADQHHREGDAEAESIALAMAFMSKEIERRKREQLSRERHAIRYRRKA